jgi:hypothetical protein
MSEHVTEAAQVATAPYELPIRNLSLAYPEEPLLIDGVPHLFVADTEKIAETVTATLKHRSRHVFPLKGVAISFETPDEQLADDHQPHQVYDHKTGIMNLTVPPSLSSLQESTQDVAQRVEATLNHQIFRGLLTYDGLNYKTNVVDGKIIGGMILGGMAGEAITELVLTPNSSNVMQYVETIGAGTAGAIVGYIAILAAISKGGIFHKDKVAKELSSRRFGRQASKINDRVVRDRSAYFTDVVPQEILKKHMNQPLFYVQRIEG